MELKTGLGLETHFCLVSDKQDSGLYFKTHICRDLTVIHNSSLQCLLVISSRISHETLKKESSFVFCQCFQVSHFWNFVILVSFCIRKKIFNRFFMYYLLTLKIKSLSAFHHGDGKSGET